METPLILVRLRIQLSRALPAGPASFLGLDEYTERLNALTAYLSRVLAALRPEPS